MKTVHYMLLNLLYIYATGLHIWGSLTHSSLGFKFYRLLQLVSEVQRQSPFHLFVCAKKCSGALQCLMKLCSVLVCSYYTARGIC